VLRHELTRELAHIHRGNLLRFLDFLLALLSRRSLSTAQSFFFFSSSSSSNRQNAGRDDVARYAGLSVGVVVKDRRAAEAGQHTCATERNF
jgi:hypothetical protein